MILGQIQVLLSEKRTALSSLRTGIAVFALPLSVLSVLIATSRSYRIASVLPFLVPLLLLNLGLVVLGCSLIYHAIHRIHHYERLIQTQTEISVNPRVCGLGPANVDYVSTFTDDGR